MHVERLTILRDRLLKIARTPVSKRTRVTALLKEAA